MVSAGVDDLDADTAMVPARAFMIGSLTKTFTGAVTLSLVEEGALSLDDPVDRWVAVGEGITVRHLLTHTSGLPDYMDHADLYRDRGTPRTPEMLADAVPRDGTPEDDRWYGLGVSVDQTTAGTAIGHHGRANGHDTWFAWYPDREVGVVVLLNRHRGDGDPAAIAAIAADLGYP